MNDAAIGAIISVWTVLLAIGAFWLEHYANKRSSGLYSMASASGLGLFALHNLVFAHKWEPWMTTAGVVVLVLLGLWLARDLSAGEFGRSNWWTIVWLLLVVAIMAPHVPVLDRYAILLQTAALTFATWRLSEDFIELNTYVNSADFERDREALGAIEGSTPSAAGGDL